MMAHKQQRNTGAVSSKGRGKGMHTNASTIWIIILHDCTQKARHKTIIARRFVNTRYHDDNVLNTLGIFGDVYWMSARLGLTQSMKVKYPT